MTRRKGKTFHALQHAGTKRRGMNERLPRPLDPAQSNRRRATPAPVVRI
jgi:hypothetical protein